LDRKLNLIPDERIPKDEEGEQAKVDFSDNFLLTPIRTDVLGDYLKNEFNIERVSQIGIRIQEDLAELQRIGRKEKNLILPILQKTREDCAHAIEFLESSSKPEEDFKRAYVYLKKFIAS